MRSVLRFLVFGFGITFAMVVLASAFELKIGRDPFMDLLKLKQLQRERISQVKSNNKKRLNVLEKQAQMLKNSLRVQMVVISKRNSKLDAALIVGPSGIPIVVRRGYKIKKGVYVTDITDKGVKIDIVEGNRRKVVDLKIGK